jgi:FKBP-type peptidyl-prolyl cis-trans isomerase FklB
MSLSDKLKSFLQQKEKNNMEAGESFLAENGKRESVVTLPSGLQYEIITKGVGEKPLAHNTVTCHYHGTTIKGEVFDSSVKRGQPASFPLNGVIKGWTEALQLMPVGSKWKLYIPPHLAYGNRSISREIGTNSTLIFEVELISFK